MNFVIDKKHERHFKAVMADCRELKDNRLPVSMELLQQLCNIALGIFFGYQACLAGVLFICVWAFSMRIYDYSSVKVWKKPQTILRRNTTSVSMQSDYPKLVSLCASYLIKLQKQATQLSTELCPGKICLNLHMGLCVLMTTSGKVIVTSAWRTEHL